MLSNSSSYESLSSSKGTSWERRNEDYPAHPISIRLLNAALTCAPVHKWNPHLRYILEFLEKDINTPEILKVFGNQDEIKVALQAILEDIIEEKHTPLGEMGLYNMIKASLEVREQVMDYIIKHPEIQSIPIEKPIIIIGLHRTGTTLLFNLLNCDDKSRAPQYWEMNGHMAVLPPPSKPCDYTHRSYIDAKTQLEKFKKVYPETFSAMQRAHTVTVEGIEEEVVILFHQLVQGTLGELMGDRYWEWLYNETNKGAAYKYLYRYLQLLTSGFAPKSHWLLKSPIHLGSFTTFLETFPDARLIMTHRNPKDVLPSIKSLYAACSSHCRTHLKDNGPQYVESMAKYMDSVIEIRNNLGPSRGHQILDIGYKSIVKDPIGTVVKIYQHFNLEVTDAFLNNMKKWLSDNPQHKHGFHNYSLEKFGMDEQHIETRWKKYYDTYGNYF